MKRVLNVIMACGLLAGCASDSYDEQRQFTGSLAPAQQSYGGGATGPLASPGARPLAMLPAGAGAVLNVLEQRGTNFITQDIILSGDVPTFGENKISLTALTARTNEFVEGRPGEINLKRATDVALYDEVIDQFPTVRMNLSENYDRNGNGPFGYAVGKSKSVTCVYAWQWLEDRERSTGFFGDKSAPGERPVASVRVRMCRQGLSEQALLAFVRQLVILPPQIGGSYANASSYGGYQPPYAGGDALAAAGGGYAPVYGGARYNQPHGAGADVRPVPVNPYLNEATPRRKIVRRKVRRQPVARVYRAPSPAAVGSWSAPQARNTTSSPATPFVQRTAVKPGAGGYASVPLPD